MTRKERARVRHAVEAWLAAHPGITALDVLTEVIGTLPGVEDAMLRERGAPQFPATIWDNPEQMRKYTGT